MSDSPQLPAALAGMTANLPTDEKQMNSLMARLGQSGREAGGVAPGEVRGTPFTKFDGNKGSFTYGKEQNPIPPDQKFIVPVSHVTHGLKYWENKRTTDSIVVPATEPFPEKPDARPWQDRNAKTPGWGKEWGLLLCGFKGKLNKINLHFTGSSNGVSKFWADVLVAIQKNWTENPRAKEGLIHPVISVGVRSYTHPDYDRTIYEPELVLHGFTDGKEIVGANFQIGDSSSAEEEAEDVLG